VSPRPLPAKMPKIHRTDKLSFHQTWRWPRDIKRWFDRELSDMVDPVPRPVLHVCCGQSKVGNVRVDRYPEHGATGLNVKADFHHLPFRDGAFGTVVIDPPFELFNQGRIQLHDELGRVLRPGGTLLWCAPWIPNEGIFTIDRVVVASLRTGLPRNARILVRATRRVPGPKVGRGQKNTASKLLEAMT
jgi:hypothetical protein